MLECSEDDNKSIVNYIAENWDGIRKKKEVFMHTQDPYEFTDTLSIDALLWPYCPYFSYLQTFGKLCI